MSCHHDNYSFAQGLYTVLGALLAILGGFGAQSFRKHLDHRDEQERLLHAANDLLLKYTTHLNQPASSGEENEASRLKRECEEIGIRDELSKIALKLKSRDLRSLALNLTRFALDKEHRSEKNLYELMREIHLKVNRSLIQEYDRDHKSAKPL